MLKKYISFLVLVLVFSISNAQCWFTDFLKYQDEASTEFKVFTERNADSYKAYQLLYDEGLVDVGRDFEKLQLATKKLSKIEKAGGYTKWKKLVESTIDQASSDETLIKALDDAGYVKSAEQVKKRKGVGEKNKNGLDKGIDEIITNPGKTYSYTRNGVTYKKGAPPAKPNETSEEYFKRLNKVEIKNGKKFRAFNQFESHHIFPVDLFKRESFRKWYELVGHKHYDFSGEKTLENLIMLEAIRRNPLSDKGIPNYLGGVHTTHPRYTMKIGDYFDKLWEQIRSSDNTASDFDIADVMDEKVIKLSQNLKKSLLENSVKGTVELPTYWNEITFNDLIMKL